MKYSYSKTDKRYYRISFKPLMAMVTALCLVLQTGCFERTKTDESNSGLKSGDIISEDTPWFDSMVIELDGGYKDKGSVEYLESEYVGCTDKAIVIHYSGNYVKGSDDSRRLIDDIVFVDPDTGEEINRTDITEYRLNGCEINNISIESGLVVCGMRVKDDLTGKKTDKCLLIDDSGEVNLRDVSESDFDENKTGEYYIDGFTYSLSYDFTSAIYSVGVKMPEGNSDSFEIAGNGTKIYDVKAFLRLDDGKILIPTYTDKGAMYFVYDPQSNKIKKDNGAFRWLDKDFDKIKGGYTNGNSGYADSDSLYVIDTKEKCAKEVFNKSFCNVNCPDLRSLWVIKADSSNITLLDIKGSDDLRNIFDTAYIYTFKKADVNPNAGKTVIELATGYNIIPDAIAQAVADYNSLSDKGCYLVTSKRYYLDNEEMPENSDDLVYLKRQAEISDQMAIDILNGNGPDMYINNRSMPQINNGNCLVDLTEIANSLTEDQYFTNILKTTADDGAVYQIPLSFLLTGIQVSSPNKIPNDGITLNAWPDFVSEYCNGIDPIYMNRDYYFMILCANMNDVFDDADAFTTDNKDLFEIAEYCKNHVSQYGMSDEDYYNNEENNIITAVYSVLGGIYDYYGELPLSGESSFIGLPSTDGRGPAFIPFDSAAISADSEHIDECKDFIKFLLSDKYQEMLADCGCNVINRKAFESGCKKYQEYFGTNNGNRTKRALLDCDIEDYTAIINNVSHMFEINSKMLSMVCEEMQAYFCNQKEYDEVIKIIADKAKKICDENK